MTRELPGTLGGGGKGLSIMNLNLTIGSRDFPACVLEGSWTDYAFIDFFTRP